MEPADAEAVSRLILAAFGTFIAQEYNEEGRREFTRYVEPAELIERVAAGHFLLLAEQDERLGFRQTGPERTVNGIVFIPMAHELTSD